VTKIDITTAGHTVIIETDAPLATVAATALELWQQTHDPDTRTGSDIVGFVSELGPRPEYESVHQIDLGGRQ
jgi:hypothetical protein